MNTPEEQVEILQKNLEMFASKVERLNYNYSEMSTKSEIGRELIQAKENLKQLNKLVTPKKEENKMHRYYMKGYYEGMIKTMQKILVGNKEEICITKKY